MTDKPVPMTTEEEYRNADVDIGEVVELQQKEIRDLVKDNQLLITEIDRLRSQIERLKNLITNEK